jgi:hypothetical protein
MEYRALAERLNEEASFRDSDLATLSRAELDKALAQRDYVYTASGQRVFTTAEVEQLTALDALFQRTKTSALRIVPREDMKPAARAELLGRIKAMKAEIASLDVVSGRSFPDADAAMQARDEARQTLRDMQRELQTTIAELRGPNVEAINAAWENAIFSLREVSAYEGLVFHDRHYVFAFEDGDVPVLSDYFLRDADRTAARNIEQNLAAVLQNARHLNNNLPPTVTEENANDYAVNLLRPFRDQLRTDLARMPPDYAAWARGRYEHLIDAIEAWHGYVQKEGFFSSPQAVSYFLGNVRL